MPINILMPALSPTMEKGNLAKWLKKEGDKVKSGDVIAEIETDKATMEVEAVDEGTLARIVVPEGTQDVPVNELIAVLAGDGEDVKAAGCRRWREVRAGESGSSEGSGSQAGSQEGRSAASEAGGRAEAGRGARASGRSSGVTGQRPRPHFLLAAGAASCERCRHRARPYQRVGAARSCHRARCRGGEVRQGAEGAGRRAIGRARDRAVDVGQADPRAVRAGRPTKSCRMTACAAPSRSA